MALMIKIMNGINLMREVLAEAMAARAAYYRKHPNLAGSE